MVTRSSIAKNILMTEAIVAEPPEKQGAGMGGMGDMGGMMESVDARRIRTAIHPVDPATWSFSGRCRCRAPEHRLRGGMR